MIKKIIHDIKSTIKELILFDYKYLLSLFLLVIVCYYPLNYYIIIGGGISDIRNRVIVEDGYKAKGSFNISFVTEANGTILTYLLSYVMPNWKRESIEEFKYDKQETKDDIDFRNNLSLNKASNDAIKVAYEEANKQIDITSTHLYVISKMYENENCTLEVGDEILEIDGNDINEINYGTYLSTKEDQESISVKVKRSGKEQLLKTKLFKRDNQILIGVYLTKIDDFKTTPKVNIKFKKSESGPSAGLMTSLAIYNQLVKEDITKGHTIAGTGTIDQDGNVGEIGGVEYKLLGAVDGKADVFLVPKGDNYKDVMKIVKKQKLKIKVIEVSTFEETIKKLEELK